MQILNLDLQRKKYDFFFFFQAEDGIRDYKVTGVQTCALPISAPTARMVACGGLITAVKSLMPYMPRLDTADVPPWYSSGLSLRARARAAKSFISAEITETGFVSAFRMIGVISPPGIATATPISECLCLSMPASVQLTLALGIRCSASANALMTKSLTESL